MDSILFKGTPGLLGGLSNEAELQKKCPEKFRSDWTSDPWCEAASSIFYNGCFPLVWKYKVTDKKEMEKQFTCFHSLLKGFGLKHEWKIAIAGWMLSEMLEEVPKPNR